MKLIFFISFIVYCLGKEYWECGNDKSLYCSKHNTCCKVRSEVNSFGWACFDTVNGVCCSDGLSACPLGYICNMRDKRCDKA